MRKLLLTFVCLISLQAMGDVNPNWKNPAVNQVNREARHAHFFAFENADKAKDGDKTKSSRYLASTS